MRFYWIVAKLLLFTFSYLLFLPLIVFIGKNEYFHGVFGGVQGFIDELYDHGCIDEAQKKELDDELMGG